MRVCIRTMALAIVVATLVPASAEGVPQKCRATAKSTSRPPAKPDPVGNLVAAIAINRLQPGETLFAACEQSSFKTLAAALDGMRTRIASEKGEYETEAEFATRRRKLEDVFNQGGEIVVCQPLDDNEDAPFRYDPEREVFKGSFMPRQNVWRDVKRLGSYVSKTRMGVRATVRSSVQIEYDVDLGAAIRERKPPCLKGDYEAEYEVRVPRTEAPLLKARGYLVFTGRLISPFISTEDTPGSPTLDDPSDVYEHSLTVKFEPGVVSVAGPIGQPAWTCDLIPNG